jgi:predicted ArsR family transcriptional regulator
MQSTRQEILDILRQEGQGTVEDLATRLKLTPMTVRHHLNVLQAQGLAEASQVRRMQTVGRPRLVYTLTDAAQDLFPQSYSDLARHLVSEVKDTMGPAQTQKLLERVAERIARGAPPPVEGQTLEERLAQVSEFLQERGLFLSWEETADGEMALSLNCPYLRVSQHHEELCTMDLYLLRRLLGVQPTQVQRLAEGDMVCRCVLRPE